MANFAVSELLPAGSIGGSFTCSHPVNDISSWVGSTGTRVLPSPDPISSFVTTGLSSTLVASSIAKGLLVLPIDTYAVLSCWI